MIFWKNMSENITSYFTNPQDQYGITTQALFICVVQKWRIPLAN